MKPIDITGVNGRNWHQVRDRAGRGLTHRSSNRLSAFHVVRDVGRQTCTLCSVEGEPAIGACIKCYRDDCEVRGSARQCKCAGCGVIPTRSLPHGLRLVDAGLHARHVRPTDEPTGRTPPQDLERSRAKGSVLRTVSTPHAQALSGTRTSNQPHCSINTSVNGAQCVPWLGDERTGECLARVGRTQAAADATERRVTASRMRAYRRMRCTPAGG